MDGEVYGIRGGGGSSSGGSAGNEAKEGAQAPSTEANFNETGLPVVNEEIRIRIPVVKQHYHKDYNEMVLVQDLEEKRISMSSGNRSRLRAGPRRKI